MNAYTRYRIKRLLMDFGPKVVGFAIMAALLALYFSYLTHPAPKPTPASTEKRSTTDFDLCAEALLRDGNGIIKTADACAKFR